MSSASSTLAASVPFDRDSDDARPDVLLGYLARSELVRKHSRPKQPSATGETTARSSGSSSGEPIGTRGLQLELFNNIPPRINPGRVSRATFYALQEWEGYVEEIGEDYVVASLVDTTAGESVSKEKAEVPLSEISEGDRDLVRVGAVFRWVIGYRKLESGQKERSSQIVFRRLPQWTAVEVRRAHSDAADLSKYFEEIDQHEQQASR